MISAEGASLPRVARGVGPKTVKHGSVRGSGRNSPGLLGNRKQSHAHPDYGGEAKAQPKKPPGG